jgi:NADH dehydrogenase/NADH:ubiquinone oxidoreductase subunit G
VFLPGSTFLEKDGTFTNAERRIQRVRKVMASKSGKADWEITLAIARAIGFAMHYDHPSQVMAQNRVGRSNGSGCPNSLWTMTGHYGPSQRASPAGRL